MFGDPKRTAKILCDIFLASGAGDSKQVGRAAGAERDYRQTEALLSHDEKCAFLPFVVCAWYSLMTQVTSASAHRFDL
jgi:hypothetical protein